MGKFILAILLIAVAIYLVVWLVESRGAIFRRGSRKPAPKRPRDRRPSGPLGPDDDPDFLRDLNRKPRKGDPDK
ncbi:hypothetical protein ASG90_10295 [Nocardioides sp. Soil797]|nr:hypothetical protein ASG90_10295 [Nocardioides sp. Soil797]